MVNTAAPLDESEPDTEPDERSSAWPASHRALVPARRDMARAKHQVRRLMTNPVAVVWLASIAVLVMLIRWRSIDVYFDDDKSLPAYCGAKPRGSEGMLQRMHPDLTLWAVAMTIRHGDRSPIHALPNTNGTAQWVCRPAGQDQRRAAGDVRVVGLDQRPLPRRTLLAQTQDGSGHCATGQLTPRGFAQHFALGRHLGRKFAPLLHSIGADHRSNLSHPRVYVRSTDYTRTQMSAAALLYGMLPLTLRPPAALPTMIHTQVNESLETMHGVGLASSSKVGSQDGGGERSRTGPCARAAQLTLAQLAAFYDDHSAKAELGEIFGAEARQMPMAQVADVLYAHACHKMRPPCGRGDKGCATPALAARFYRAGDESYCAKYNGLLGGLQASQLAMHPLLTEIVERLTRALAGSGERLLLFSGHDTVVAQLLAALGGMAETRHCRWPPYASHLVFELWRPHTAAAAAARQTQIRVTYNGVVVTPLLPGCGGPAGSIGSDPADTMSAATVGAHELCPFAAFVQAVLSRVPKGSSFEAECARDGGSDGAPPVPA